MEKANPSPAAAEEAPDDLLCPNCGAKFSDEFPHKVVACQVSGTMDIYDGRYFSFDLGGDTDGEVLACGICGAEAPLEEFRQTLRIEGSEGPPMEITIREGELPVWSEFGSSIANVRCLVAYNKEEGLPVGYLQYSEQSSDHKYPLRQLLTLEVKKPHRKQKIGTRLVQNALQGISRAFGLVNDSSKGLVERLGFRERLSIPSGTDWYLMTFGEVHPKEIKGEVFDTAHSEYEDIPGEWQWFTEKHWPQAVKNWKAEFFLLKLVRMAFGDRQRPPYPRRLSWFRTEAVPPVVAKELVGAMEGETIKFEWVTKIQKAIDEVAPIVVGIEVGRQDDPVLNFCLPNWTTQLATYSKNQPRREFSEAEKSTHRKVVNSACLKAGASETIDMRGRSGAIIHARFKWRD
jgi:hypothetical protein